MGTWVGVGRHPGRHWRGSGRLVRTRDGRMIAGVADGIAQWRGINVTAVRFVFAVMTVAGGSGLLLYVLAWLLLPAEGADTTIAQRALQSPLEPTYLVAAALIVLGSVLALGALGLTVGGTVWPTGLAVLGLTVVWRHGDEVERAPLAKLAAVLPWAELPVGSKPRRLVFLRIAVGATLVIGGLAAFLHEAGAVNAVRNGVIGFVGIVGGIALILGPWWWKLAQQLTEERRERVRSQERAEMAAHLHDSVLQTLALIQRSADDPRAVTTLARRQERELRAWLFDGPAPEDEDAVTVAAAVTAAADEVEQRHGVAIDAITVGDADLDDDGLALVAACREAMVNAAKWSGQALVSVYMEAEPTMISVYVRDRGQGFDLDAVSPDRKGVSESIVGRMERHGGKAVVRTSPGLGTEVELRLPRSGS